MDTGRQPALNQIEERRDFAWDVEKRAILRRTAPRKLDAFCAVLKMHATMLLGQANAEFSDRRLRKQEQRSRTADEIRVIQINMNRSRLADELLYQLAFESNTDIVLISEQYRNRDQPTWFSDPLSTSAIWISSSRNIRVEGHGSEEGFVWVRCEAMTFFSCYLTPNESIQQFRTKIDALEDAIFNTQGEVIVGGDFNAKAIEWSMPHPDSRGRCILEMAARTGLIVLNEREVTTFRRPGYSETIPDVSFASEALVPRIVDWKVSENYTGSDHQAITFTVYGRSEARCRAGRSTETALLELTGTNQKALDEGETAVCIFLDISGAFGNTLHEAVRQALEKKEVSPQRQLRLTAFGAHCIGYADDIAIIAKGKFEKILCELIQMSLRITNEWCRAVELSINSSKTTFVPFTRKRKISIMKDIRLGGTLIECKSELKYLGITLEKKLLWNRHIALTTNKATSVLMIGRNLKVAQVTTRNVLDKLRRLACVCMTGAMRTCPAAVLEVILDLTPLHIVVEGVAHAAMYRLTRAGTEGNEMACQREGPQPKHHHSDDQQTINFVLKVPAAMLTKR
ncbi:hypothetical protein Trydic_g11665 [Trypoxylus dichotomus]